VNLPDIDIKPEPLANEDQLKRRLLGGGTYWVEAPRNVNSLSQNELKELVSSWLYYLLLIAQSISSRLPTQILAAVLTPIVWR
jgi:hypothetical protein